MADLLGLHASACVAYMIASGYAWSDCPSDPSSLDFDSDEEIDPAPFVGKTIVVAFEEIPSEILIPSRRLALALNVVLVLRNADERRLRVYGSAAKPELLKKARETKDLVFDPSVGRFGKAVLVPRGVFGPNSDWDRMERATSAHNTKVVPNLVSDDTRPEHKRGTNKRKISLDELHSTEVVLNYANLKLAYESVARKRTLFGYMAGVDGGSAKLGFGGGPVESHILGAGGEVCVEKLGFGRAAIAGTMKAEDFAGNVWVGTRRDPTFELIVQPKDVKESWFPETRNILMVMDSPQKMRAVGYIFGHEVIELIRTGKAPLIDPTGKRPNNKAHFIKQQYLRPLQELIDAMGLTPNLESKPFQITQDARLT